MREIAVKFIALTVALSLPGGAFAQTVRFTGEAASGLPVSGAAGASGSARISPISLSLTAPALSLRSSPAPTPSVKAKPGAAAVPALPVMPALAAPEPEAQAAQETASNLEETEAAHGKILSPAALRTRRALRFLSKISGARGLWEIYRDTFLVQRFAVDVSNAKLPAARRLSAARRLAPLGGADSIPVLGLAAQSDSDAEVRQAARESVLALAKTWTPRLIRELRFHPRNGRRLRAAQALGWIARETSDPRVVEVLSKSCSSDRNEEVRLAAIEALSAAQSPKALPALRWMLAATDGPHIRSALERALASKNLPAAPPVQDAAESRRPLYARALKRVLGIGSVFAAIEFAGAFVTKSLSLQADAMHLTADLAITGVALFSLWMARRPPSSRKSYGYLKLESVTGLVSALAIAGLGIHMAVEAVGRLWAPVAVPGAATILLALAGLSSNVLSTLMLYRYKDDNLSLRGAFIHAATDAAGSLGIITAGLLIMKFGWFIADPLITFVIVGLILHTTWDLAKRSWNVLIDSVPEGMSLDEIEAGFLAIPGCASVSDLHVWALNSASTALTVKLLIRPGTDSTEILRQAKELAAKHKIGHATIQVEHLP